MSVGGAAEDRAPAQVTILEARSAFHWLDLREIWQFRDLLGVLVARDVKVRYRQATLGAAWALLRPAIAMVLFSVVFGRFARMPSEGAPYPLFVISGVLPWTFFSGAVAAAAESLVGAQQLVTKVYFPRLVVPLAALGAPLVDLLVTLPLLAAVAWHFDQPPGPGWLLLPAAILLLVLSTLGLATWLSALNVAYRDVRHLLPFALQIGLYATPVVFPVDLVPEAWRIWIFLNPAAGAVEAFRAIVLARPIDPAGLAVSLASSLVLLLAGLAYFSKVERRFADIV